MPSLTKETGEEHVVHQHIDAEQRCDLHREVANCRETSDAPRSPDHLLATGLSQCSKVILQENEQDEVESQPRELLAQTVLECFPLHKSEPCLEEKETLHRQ